MESYQNALRSAFSFNFPEDVIVYIFRGIQNIDNNFDINSLWENLYNCSSNALILMIKLGANINYISPSTGSTPIMYYAQSGNRENVKILIENNADLTIKNNKNMDVYRFATDKVNIHEIIKEINDSKEKDALIERNKMLENQCQQMNEKINYLMDMFGKIKLGDSVDFSHKKIKSVDEN